MQYDGNIYFNFTENSGGEDYRTKMTTFEAVVVLWELHCHFRCKDLGWFGSSICGDKYFGQSSFINVPLNRKILLSCHSFEVLKNMVVKDMCVRQLEIWPWFYQLWFTEVLYQTNFEMLKKQTAPVSCWLREITLKLWSCFIDGVPDIGKLLSHYVCSDYPYKTCKGLSALYHKFPIWGYSLLYCPIHFKV